MIYFQSYSVPILFTPTLHISYHRVELIFIGCMSLWICSVKDILKKYVHDLTEVISFSVGSGWAIPNCTQIISGNLGILCKQTPSVLVL